MHPYICTDKKILCLLKELFPRRKSKPSNSLFSTITWKDTQGKVFISLPEISADAPLWEENSSSIYISWFAITGAWSHSLRCLVGTCCACLHYTTSLTVLVIPPRNFSYFTTAPKTCALIPGLGHDRAMSNSYVLEFKPSYSSPCSHNSHGSIKWQNGILPNISFSLKKRQLLKEFCYISHISSQK